MTIWISPKDLALKLGVTQQAISKQIRVWRNEGALTDADCQFRGKAVMQVSEAKYLHLKQRFTNPNMARSDAAEGGMSEDLELLDDDRAAMADGEDTGAGSSKPIVDQDGLNEAKRRQAWLDLELKALAMAERKGRLVSVERLEIALITVGKAIQAKINRLENQTEEFASAFETDGTHGLRVALREFSFQLCDELTADLTAIGREAHETDALEDDAE